MTSSTTRGSAWRDDKSRATSCAAAGPPGPGPGSTCGAARCCDKWCNTSRVAIRITSTSRSRKAVADYTRGSIQHMSKATSCAAARHNRPGEHAPR